MVLGFILEDNKTKNLFMKVFGKMIKNMALEFIDFQTRINMRACGRMILDMEMEPMILVQETHTAENGVLIKYMA